MIDAKTKTYHEALTARSLTPRYCRDPDIDRQR